MPTTDEWTKVTSLVVTFKCHTNGEVEDRVVDMTVTNVFSQSLVTCMHNTYYCCCLMLLVATASTSG